MKNNATPTPEVLTAVLRHLGWRVDAGESGLFEVWMPAGRDDVWVTVPFDEGRGDYEGLLERAVGTIRAVDGNAADEVMERLQLIATAGLEQTKWRKESPVDGGLISWTQGEALVNAARQQLQAAARSAQRMRPRHGSASAHVASAFLDAAYMGQTEVGSFILTAYAPVAQRFYFSRQVDQFSAHPTSADEFVTGRDILNTFKDGTQAVRSCLDQFRVEGRPEIFVEAVTDGISLELVKALSAMAEGSAVSISMSSDHSAVEPIVFMPVDIPVLEKATQALISDVQPVVREVTGEVTILHAGSQLPYRTVQLQVGERGLNVVKLHLTTEMYEMALEAHRQKRLLTVRGRLEREGRLWWLYDVSHASMGRPIGEQMFTEPLFEA